MANPYFTIGAVAVGVVSAGITIVAVAVGVVSAGIGILQVPGWIATAHDSAARSDLSQIADAEAAALEATGS